MLIHFTKESSNTFNINQILDYYLIDEGLGAK
jgi:hypothetical protein